MNQNDYLEEYKYDNDETALVSTKDFHHSNYKNDKQKDVNTKVKEDCL